MSRPKPLKNLLGFVTRKAPKLAGKLLEGGLDLATGGAVGKIKELILGDNELSEEDKQLAILELQQDHQEYLAELQDRQDARSMNETAIRSDDPFIRRFPAYLATALLFLVFLLCVGLIFFEIPESNRPVIFSIVGSLVAVVASVGGFYYGSSSGSKEKSGQLTEMLSKIKK